MSFSPRDFISGIVKDVVTDEDVQASVKKFFGEVVTEYIVPIVPAAVSAAVEKTLEKVRETADLNDDGKVDLEDGAKAVHDTFDSLLPPFLKPFLPRWN